MCLIRQDNKQCDFPHHTQVYLPLNPQAWWFLIESCFLCWRLCACMGYYAASSTVNILTKHCVINYNNEYLKALCSGWNSRMVQNAMLHILNLIRSGSSQLSQDVCFVNIKGISLFAKSSVVHTFGFVDSSGLYKMPFVVNTAGSFTSDWAGIQSLTVYAIAEAVINRPLTKTSSQYVRSSWKSWRSISDALSHVARRSHERLVISESKQNNCN